MTVNSAYIGRFAPSPTGPLHAGSLLAALASWLDARAHQGRWLLRIEDVDRSRCRPEWGLTIVQQLAAYGLHSDGPILWQSQRSAHYLAALEQLAQQGLTYPCSCSRKRIQAHWLGLGQHKDRHADLIYPGFCRPPAAAAPQPISSQHSLRLHTLAALQAQQLPTRLDWHDRWLGPQSQDLSQAVGDFVLRRADGCYSYQIAVVIDDAEQGISHIVRGLDLLDNTPRQILLQRSLGLATPQYGHTALVLAADGQKLSKQNGAAALPYHKQEDILMQLQLTAHALQLPAPTPAANDSIPAYLASLIGLWQQRWM